MGYPKDYDFIEDMDILPDGSIDIDIISNDFNGQDTPPDSGIDIDISSCNP